MKARQTIGQSPFMGRAIKALRAAVGKSARVASHAGTTWGVSIVHSSTRKTIIVQGIRLFTWWSIRCLTYDRENLLNDIAAGAACSTPQQIFNRSAELCFRVVLVDKIPINLI
jgi:hypothetical protein